MFLGNLSTANEHKTRKKSGKKKSKSGSSSDTGLETDETKSARYPEISKPIIYRSDDDMIPREAVYEFLTNCSKMLLEESNQMDIIRDSIESKIGLHDAAMKFQKDIMEFHHQIEREYGCKYLSMIQMKYANDPQIIDATKNFMYNAMRSYVEALKMRHRKYESGELKGPKPNTPMSKVDILEFFEGCNALMAMQETKDELKKIHESTKKIPNERIVEMQRDVLFWIGFDRDFGVKCLNNISKDFPNDREITGKFPYFATAAELACQEATFTKEEKEDFYKNLPPLLHHTPQLYVVQQRARHQQMMMMQQQQNQQHQATGASQPNKLVDADALKKTGILNLLSSPDGRMKIQDLASRVQACKQRIEPDINTWDEEKKKQYFTSFAENHPFVDTLRTCGDDPMAKISKFMEMSDGELEEMMKLMLVVAFDKGSGLIESLNGKSEGSSSSEAQNERFTAMNNIFATMGSLSSFRSRAPNPNQMAHDHSHSHAHGEHCPVHGGAGSKPAADISTGGEGTMDR